VVREAPQRETENGLVPEGDGWYVVNACDVVWTDDGPFGVYTNFQGDVRFPQYGVNLAVLEPGQPNCMYHREDEQEDFLVLSGECLFLVEGEERRLRAWDFVHCPAWTEHVFVGGGDRPCVLLLVGGRTERSGVVYPISELAGRYGGSVERETTSPQEAYAPFPAGKPMRYRDGSLPGA
jgi:uncharacterized cupin superfamily protein